jgi:hypothetical protein
VRVLEDRRAYNTLEDAHGRMRTVHAGDRIVGVLGSRAALRGFGGVVPDALEVGDEVHLLNLGGVLGRCTAPHPELGLPVRCEVLGAVMHAGAPAHIVPGPVAPEPGDPGALPPVLVLAGTCMHAGKTAAACALVRGAASRGLRVGAVKLTGVALMRDVLEMEDHGAVTVATFADAGLPSTCDAAVGAVARGLLGHVARARVDLIVAELGDGLLGRYGVRELLADPVLKRSAAGLVLAATDPVAAWGGVQVLAGLGWTPTAITGPATDNDAGVGAIVAETGVLAINARLDPRGLASSVLDRALGPAGVRLLAAEAS